MTTRNPFAGDAPDGPARPDAGKGDLWAPGDARAQDVVGGANWSGARLHVAPDPEADLACCRLPLTDLGNAERWRVRFGRDFRFCAEIGWFAWDGRRWKLLSEERDRLPARVMQSVFATVRAIRNEAALVAASGHSPVIGLSDKEAHQLETWCEAQQAPARERYAGDLGGRDGKTEAEWGAWLEALEPMDLMLGTSRAPALWSQKIAAWAKTSEGSDKLGSVAKLAKAFPAISIETGELDADRMAINVLNGTLRLVKGNEKRNPEEIAAGKSEWHSVWKIKKTPHDRADLITKLAPVKYAPAAQCPEFDKFLTRVQPDEHMRRFLHQWGGYSLVGDTTEHKLAFFHGGGRNGKGTFVEAVAHLAGDYAGSIGIESLIDTGMKRRGDQATPDLAALPAVRFLRVSEPQTGTTFNEGLIKQLTGGDPVKARHLNKSFFEFFPDFKITISGNNKPKVKDQSYGMWARMQLVPWEVTIPDEEIDRGLPERLQAEAGGILNRLLAGLLDWRQNGLIVPEQVRMATRKYQDDSDDVGRFLSQLCVVSGDRDKVRVGAKFLHDLYLAWAKHAGASEISLRTFKTMMENKGFEQKTSDGVKWLGVAVRDGVTIDEVEKGRWSAEAVSEAEGSGPDDGQWATGEGGDWVPDDDPPPGFG